MTTEQYSIGYDEGYQAGWNAAMEASPAQQQEPVAWMWRCKPYCDWPKWSVSLKRPADSGRDGQKRTEGYEDVPLYTSPPTLSLAQRTWVGLTDEEKSDIWCVVTNRDFVTEDTHVYADAIEAKLKEKNT